MPASYCEVYNVAEKRIRTEIKEFQTEHFNEHVCRKRVTCRMQGLHRTQGTSLSFDEKFLRKKARQTIYRVDQEETP